MVKQRRQYTADFKFQFVLEALVGGSGQRLGETIPQNVVRPIPICVIQNSGNGQSRAAAYCSDESRIKLY